MSAGKIEIDKLASSVQMVLNDYRDCTMTVMEQATERVAKETVNTIRENIDAAGFKSKGGYRKSWTQKKDPNMRGRWSAGRVVHSKEPHYRVAHLLEHGHAKVNGGRVEGRPHIQPAEEAAEKKLMKYIQEGIEEG